MVGDEKVEVELADKFQKFQAQLEYTQFEIRTHYEMTQETLNK